MDRPVNTRLYRTAWLVVALPLLAAAFTVTRPAPLPAAEIALQPTFDNAAAFRLARELATVYPDRSPGAPASAPAARWVKEKLGDLGLKTEVDRFEVAIPGRGRTELRNVTAVVPGRSRDTIVVVAHRDSTRGYAGTNDNASGTGALIELARAYAATRTSIAGGVSPNHTILFASTDAGAYGLLGARQLARQAPYAKRVVAVVVLDSVGSHRPPRLELAGPGPKSAAPGIVATASARIASETGRQPTAASVLGQLVDLAFPFTLTEQGEFLAEGIPAVTVTTERSRAAQDERPGRLDPVRLGQIGRAVEGIVASLDASLEPARGTNDYVYVRGRVIQGWAIAFLYVALLVPFALATADLIARLRRRGIPFRPAIRSYVRRLVFWLMVGVLFTAFGLLGAWPNGDAAAISPASEAAGHWPRLALASFTILVLGMWLIARSRLMRRGPVGDDEEVVAMAVPLAALGLIAFVLIVTNAWALLFILPSAHAWLWLIQARTRRASLRTLLYVGGLAGPLLLLGSIAVRFGLGFDAPWYLAELTAIGYVSTIELFLVLAWVAVAAQTLAVLSGRYGPYPAPGDRPARGPVGTAVAALRRSRQELS